MNEKESKKEEKPKVEENSKAPKNSKPIIDLSKVINVKHKTGLFSDVGSGSNENKHRGNFPPLDTNDK